MCESVVGLADSVGWGQANMILQPVSYIGKSLYYLYLASLSVTAGLFVRHVASCKKEGLIVS